MMTSTWATRTGLTGMVGLALLAGGHVGVAPAAAEDDDPPRLPAGDAGIAAQFPGDAGIADHPAVVFVENFEHDAIDDLFARWETVREPEKMTFSDDTPPGSAGRQSLLMDRREGGGPHLYRRIGNQAADRDWGHDRLFFRYYIKFAPETGEWHHGPSALGGNHPATPHPMVSAGNPPDGDRSFWSGIETYGEDLRWDYYTYWTDMRGSPPAGQTWGNSFIRDENLRAPRGRWVCIEHMIKLNDVGEANGEQALWIDGELISHLGPGFPKGLWTFDKFEPGRGGQGVIWGDNGRETLSVPEGGAPFEGFRWRTDEDLTVNFIWFYLYTQREAGHVLKATIDHVVVATEYIGPITPAEGESR